MFIDESQYGSFEFLGAEWDNDSVIRKLKGRKVVELHLNETSVDDDFFQSLQLKNLRRLYLNSSILGDAGVADALERCFCLECLRLSTPLVTDDSMSLIPKHQTIVDISLVESSVTDSGLHYLSRLPNLSSLDISNLQISDEGISSIRSKTIDRLSFDNCPITGTGFSAWNVSDKCLVSASGSMLNSAGFSKICEAFPHLWEFAFARTGVCNDWLKLLPKKSPISEIVLEHTKITAAGIEWLLNNRQVFSLYADASQVNEELTKMVSKKEECDLCVEQE